MNKIDSFALNDEPTNSTHPSGQSLVELLISLLCGAALFSSLFLTGLILWTLLWLDELSFRANHCLQSVGNLDCQQELKRGIQDLIPFASIEDLKFESEMGVELIVRLGPWLELKSRGELKP